LAPTLIFPSRLLDFYWVLPSASRIAAAWRGPEKG
jgi:hypothetical protein